MKDVHKRCAFCKYWKYIGQIDLVCMRKRGSEYMKDKKWDDTCKHFERVEDAETRELGKALGVLSNYCDKHFHAHEGWGERECDKECIFLRKEDSYCWFEPPSQGFPDYNIKDCTLARMLKWHEATPYADRQKALKGDA